MGEKRILNNLEIYNLAENLAIKIYKITRKFPKEELYGIISQIRRSAVSIAINIAEGYGRYHFKDRSMFLYNARGSLLETKSLISISFKLRFVNREVYRMIIGEIDNLGIKINNFIRYLKSNK